MGKNTSHGIHNYKQGGFSQWNYLMLQKKKNITNERHSRSK